MFIDELNKILKDVLMKYSASFEILCYNEYSSVRNGGFIFTPFRTELAIDFETDDMVDGYEQSKTICSNLDNRGLATHMQSFNIVYIPTKPCINKIHIIATGVGKNGL